MLKKTRKRILRKYTPSERIHFSPILIIYRSHIVRYIINYNYCQSVHLLILLLSVGMKEWRPKNLLGLIDSRIQFNSKVYDKLFIGDVLNTIEILNNPTPKKYQRLSFNRTLQAFTNLPTVVSIDFQFVNRDYMQRFPNHGKSLHAISNKKQENESFDFL